MITNPKLKVPMENIHIQSKVFGQERRELSLVVHSTEGLTSIPHMFDELWDSIVMELKRIGFCREDLCYAKIFMSDSAQHQPLMSSSDLHGDLLANLPYSVWGQSPFVGGGISLLLYGVESIGMRRRSCEHRGGHVLSLEGGGQHLNFSFGNTSEAPGVRQQSQEIFNAEIERLYAEGLNMKEHTIRSWIGIRDIDLNYTAMVEVRNEIFDREGLSEDFRCFASTGIESKTAQAEQSVHVDFVSMGGICEEQIQVMHAADYMGSTADYGVRFERGTRVNFGDRSHLYISGTASIDPEGNIVAPGDILGQCMRMLENVEALLAEQNAKLSDLQHAVVYLRDPHHRYTVTQFIRDQLPEGIPLVIVQGSVCRPGWLVEMEGFACLSEEGPWPPFLSDAS
jgi:enamine deaminase RidA (YjgF/YER057c/UK114 family)